MAEGNFAIGEILAALKTSAAGGGCSELEKAQNKKYCDKRSKTTMFCAVSRERLSHNNLICGYGGIGRRARFRF